MTEVQSGTAQIQVYCSIENYAFVYGVLWDDVPEVDVESSLCKA